MVSITVKVKTVVAIFWPTFGKIGLLFIPKSGYTDTQPSPSLFLSLSITSSRTHLPLWSFFLTRVKTQKEKERHESQGFILPLLNMGPSRPLFIVYFLSFCNQTINTLIHYNWYYTKKLRCCDCDSNPWSQDSERPERNINVGNFSQ